MNDRAVFDVKGDLQATVKKQTSTQDNWVVIGFRKEHARTETLSPEITARMKPKRD